MLILYLLYKLYLYTQKILFKNQCIYLYRKMYHCRAFIQDSSDIQIINTFWLIKLTKLSCIEYPLLKKLEVKINLPS